MLTFLDKLLADIRATHKLERITTERVRTSLEHVVALREASHRKDVSMNETAQKPDLGDVPLLTEPEALNGLLAQFYEQLKYQDSGPEVFLAYARHLLEVSALRTKLHRNLVSRQDRSDVAKTQHEWNASPVSEP